MIQSWLRNYKSEVVSEKIDVRKMVKESAVHINELERQCSMVYSNFCAKFSVGLISEIDLCNFYSSKVLSSKDRVALAMAL